MDIKNLELKYFLIILIVILLIYLIYINFIENKTIESFKSRNSLATYYHSDDDFNFDNTDSLSHQFNQNKNDSSYVQSHWNGSYSFTTNSNILMYVTFLQVNKTVLFVINRVKYQISEPNVDPYVMDKDSTQKQCLPGMLIAQGELNLDETLFYMKNVYCSNNTTGDGQFDPMGSGTPIENGNLSENLLVGNIDENGTISLTQYNESGDEISSSTLTKQDSYKFGPSAQYLLRTSYNIPAPNVENSIKINPDVCYNSTFTGYSDKGTLKNCYITDTGLPTPTDESSDNGYSYNSYGTGCSIESEMTDAEDGDGSTYKACPINKEQTCYIPIQGSDGTTLTMPADSYAKCNTIFDLSVNNQSSLMYPYYMKDKNSANLLQMCNHLEGFQSGTYNSAIIMYVDNLADVQSLHYDFFGIQKGENYLTTKLDIMFPYMNEYILKQYRENMNNEDSIQLTNCIQEYNSTGNFNSIISGCAGTYNKVQDQYEQMKSKLLSETSISKSKRDSLNELYNVIEKIDSSVSQNNANNLLQPTVWDLGFLKNEETGSNEPIYTNDCSFTISTSDKYTKENRFVKYAEFDSSTNNTSMNLYKGGNKQKLVLENPYVLNSYQKIYGSDSEPNTDSNGISNAFILLTGNLRTYHPKKYLVPGQNNKFNSFGKSIYLNNEVNPSGKWVILGFNLTNNLDNANSINSYNTTLMKTLHRISEAINDSSS